MSTLSISSGSSRGSLGSLSASSKGSLASLSFQDIYYGQSGVDVNLAELHRRVEKLLQGHSCSPLAGVPEGTGESDLRASTSSLYVPREDTSNNLYRLVQNVDSREEVAGVVASTPFMSRLTETAQVSGPVVAIEHAADSSESPATSRSNLSLCHLTEPSSHAVQQQPLPPCASSMSPHSCSVSSLSPPVSPYDICPPPSYEQHLQRQRQASVGPAVPADQKVPPEVNLGAIAIDSKHLATNSSSSSRKLITHLPVNGATEPIEGYSLPRRALFGAETVPDCSNPPLSPISESSSGVCNSNNLSGGGTRSVSAAVSDESVAGDSGVFEASMKK